MLMGCLIQAQLFGLSLVILYFCFAVKKFLFHDYKLSLLLDNIICGVKMFGKYIVLTAK